MAGEEDSRRLVRRRRPRPEPRESSRDRLDVSADDRDLGWNEPTDHDPDEWYQSERPPHHDG